MFESRIHFLGPAANLTLLQRAEEIYRMQYEMSRFFEKKEWIISGKVAIDMDNKKDTISKIVKVLKKTVRRNTFLKEVPDDYSGTSTSLSIYNLEYSDYSLIFRYLIGDKSEVSKHSEILIYNYEILINTLGFTIFKEIIKRMSGLLSATTIEVPDCAHAKELQEMLGSTVDVKIIGDNLY